jgi:hypothetical protein
VLPASAIAAAAAATLPPGIEPLESRWLLSNTGAPPVLTGSGMAATFQENGPPVAVDAGLTLTDPDAGDTLDGASVTITAGFDAADDLLAFTPAGGITGSYNAAAGVLTLTGTASIAEYETALQSVTYDNIDPNAAPSSRTISFSIAPGALFNPETGHFYDFVSVPHDSTDPNDHGILWTQARAAAASQSLFGLQGYLATITSQQENNFAASKLEETGWIGSSDAAVEGEWRWVTGPEGLENGGAGRLFWVGNFPSGAAQAGQYANWNTGEPNDTDNGNPKDPNGEDYGHMIFSPLVGPLGTWNDLADRGPFDPYIPFGYLIEYGGMPGDPTLSLSATNTVNIVDNVPPVLGDLESAAEECGNVAEGQTATISAPFTDGNPTDTHTATVDWGDGTPLTNASIIETPGGGTGSLTAGHAYASGGIYGVTVTLKDSQGATDSETTSLFVTGAGVHAGVLQVIGTSAADQVQVSEQGSGTLKVHANFLRNSPRTFSSAGVSGVYVLLCEGNDKGTVSSGISIPAVVDGGTGDDALNGGRKALLVGGTGRDRLVGGPGASVLVGGSLRPTVSVAAQLAVARGTATLSTADVLDDGDGDVLTGGSGLDTLFAGNGDKVTGK